MLLPAKKLESKDQYFCWVPTKNKGLIILNGYNPPVTGPLYLDNAACT